MYIFTLAIFVSLFLLPVLFFKARHKNLSTLKNIFAIHIILFTYWNVVFWGVLYGYLSYSFAVFGTGDPEGSIFMGYWLITPIITLAIAAELFYLFFRRKKG